MLKFDVPGRVADSDLPAQGADAGGDPEKPKKSFCPVDNANDSREGNMKTVLLAFVWLLWFVALERVGEGYGHE
jgi:hypothetical protein